MIEMNAAAKAAKLLGLSGTQRRDFFVAYGQKRATFDLQTAIEMRLN